MKYVSYIFLILLTTSSCVSHKNLSNDIVHDANAEKFQQILQRSKDAFFSSDSADIIRNDLGWAERLVTGAKIRNHTIPSVFRKVGDDVFRVEMPCREFDSDEFLASTVVVEHKRLDSALVKAKIRGVDDIYMRLMDDYGDYMRQAQFSCLYIMKEKKKYLVNATILIPKKKYVLSPDLHENLMRLANEIENSYNSNKTEKAETPVEQE